jgi:hypothetical protein
MHPENLVDSLSSHDGERRALISQRGDGTFLVTFERRIIGDGLYEPKFYWSRDSIGSSIVATREDAAKLARTALGV